MTPTEQVAESCKYVCTQFCAVPLEDGRFALFWSYGAVRAYQGDFTAEELSARLREDFARQKQRRQRELDAIERGRQSIATLDIPLDLDFKI